MKNKFTSSSKPRKPNSGFWVFVFLVVIFLQATTPSFAAPEWWVSGLNLTWGGSTSFNSTTYNGPRTKGIVFTAGQSGNVIDAIGMRLAAGGTSNNLPMTLKLSITSVDASNKPDGVLATDIVTFTSPPTAGTIFETSVEYTFRAVDLVNISQYNLVAGTTYGLVLYGADYNGTPNGEVVLARQAPAAAAPYTTSGGFTVIRSLTGNNLYDGSYFLAIGKVAPPSAGDGTAGNPYQIATLDNLYWLSQTTTVWGSNTYFIQTADIDATSTASWEGGKGFKPIGRLASSKRFDANYDGNGKSISNLSINRPLEDGVGLFGHVSQKISNLTLLSLIHI